MRDNPQFDIDPKWAELVREKANLPLELQKRLPTIDRKKGPGRPPILASPPTSVATSISSAAASLPTSLASNLPFSSLASGLSGINPSLLSSINFDPKTNLLLPFGGVPNMNAALSSMGGLGNMNLFANLAIGMGGLAGMDGGLSAGDHAGSSAGGSTGGGLKSKSRKQQDAAGGSTSSSTAATNSKSPSVSTASGMPSSIPFFFPNPSLLYPLGLTGLSPFALQAGSMPQAYDSLALLNGGLGISSGGAANTTTSRHKTSTSGRSTASVTASTTPSVSARQSSGSRSATPQFQLPADSHLLDTLTKSRTTDTAKSRMREVDSLRTLISHIGGSPFNFAGLGGVDPKKLKDHELLESLHNKFPVDMFGRLGHAEKPAAHAGGDLMEKLLKRSAPDAGAEQRPAKRPKEINVPAMSKLFSSNNVTVTAESVPAGMDLSGGAKEAAALDCRSGSPAALTISSVPKKTSLATIVAETRARTPPPPVAPPSPPAIAPADEKPEEAPPPPSPPKEAEAERSDAASDDESKDAAPAPAEPEKEECRKRKPRHKKNPIAPEEAIERKNLRSSAGRAAAVAAARAARAAAAQDECSAEDRKDEESVSGL